MSLADAARELDVSPATLRRWAQDGLVPLPDGEWTRGSLAHARIVSRLRARGHSMDEIREASRSGRLAYGFMEDLFPPRSPTYSLEEAAEACGLEPALLERIWSARRLLGAGDRRDHRGGPAAAALHRRGAAGRLPARRLPPARARLRAGAGAHRRRRGQALPPLRARAADARRASTTSRWRRRCRGWRASCCRSPRRSWTTSTSASCSTSSTRTSSATWSSRSTRTATSTSAACAWRSPSPTSRATRG